MNIGEASKATGISVKMLRYYEEIGLVRPALRAYTGYRVYTERTIATLRFVRRARDLGFKVSQIGSLLELWRDGGRASADVKALALDHVRALEERRRALEEMIAALKRLGGECRGDGRPDCPILAGLGAADAADPVAGSAGPARRGAAAPMRRTGPPPAAASPAARSAGSRPEGSRT